MAKVKLEGAVNLEFEVKYGLDEDRTINVQAIEFEVDGKQYKVLIGQGDICDIPTKTLEFIGSRIEYFLKEDKSLIIVNGVGGFFKPGHKLSVSDSIASKISDALMETEISKIMLKTYKTTLDERRDLKALKEVVERNLWFISTSGMIEFCRLKRWYNSMSNVINKYF
jgi:hypothetical protein